MKEKTAVEITPSPHAEAAMALVEKLRALRAEIPRYTAEEPGAAKAMSTKAALSEQFLEAAGAALQASPLLDGSSPTTAAALRDSLAFALAHEVLRTEAKAFERAVSHTIRSAKAAAGARALDIYAIAQRLVKSKEGAELVPHVTDMRHKLQRGRRKATSEPAPDPSVKTAPKQ